MAAESGDPDQQPISNDDRYSMRFVINTLKRKWPQVPSVTTGTLQDWMKAQRAPAGQGTQAQGNPQAGDKQQPPRALTIIVSHHNVHSLSTYAWFVKPSRSSEHYTFINQT